jgi:hypothetical protein
MSKKTEIIALIDKAIEIVNSDKTWPEKYEEITYLRIYEFINNNGYSFVWNKPKEDSFCFQATSYVNQLISFKIKLNWTKND